MSKINVITLISMTSLLMCGCSTTRENFVSDLQKQGANPFIVEPELKNLEEKIRSIAMAERKHDAPYHLVFDPRNEAIISYFQDRFNKQTMMEMINLARAGYDAAVAARYPHIGSVRGCDLVDNGAYAVTDEVNKDQFDWRFVQGECFDGLAHGIGEAVDEKLSAHFVGRFDQGVMIEGVFTMLLEDNMKLIQMGEVPSKDRTARLLTTTVRKDGYQWHRYGDFKDGEINGFGINIWGYTNLMIVRSIGEYKNGTFEGFGARQLLKPFDDGKVWNTWIGNYVDGTLNGPGAWTNSIDELSVGYWKEGKFHGQVYGAHVSQHYFNESYTGTYINNKREGAFRVRSMAEIGDRVRNFTRIYSGDKLIHDGEDSSTPDFGKLIALGAGLAVIGSAGISDTKKVDIGNAFAKDVLVGGDGQNLNTLKQKLAPAGQGQTISADDKGDKGIFQLSCYDPGSFICIDYTLYSRTKADQFRSQCSQGTNKVIASCDHTSRQAICSHQSAIGKTKTHDYLYGSEPEQVKQACTNSGGQFRMVE
ncbi:hypothetical protein Q4508_14800 [Amphritea sp. 2_MG-2023]|uniref:hypothetical protein n=1 Tax=Amphritea TaxID=515417 RepID=UPI001C07881F|nr:MULTISPECIES: hypothetical protein [Amphritea]MBU2966388.1 hypothetical protein [Amphritea atlantica]MDO6419826.1 hypothetical protein [Amphritea sp. 2_MG-2023]